MATSEICTFLLVAVLIISLVNCDGNFSESVEPGNLRRRLSTSKDYVTQQSLRTYNGMVTEITCPLGYWRPSGSSQLVRVTGQRQDGCKPCPLGVYGSATGLEHPTCTAPCPVGTYATKVASRTVKDCALCPPGRYGVKQGLISPDCSYACPTGKYSAKYGSVSIADCKTCLPGYRGWQCNWAIQPRSGQDQDHQHLESFGLPTGFKDPIPQPK